MTAEERAQGREASIVTEMTKQLLQKQIREITRCFQDRLGSGRKNWYSCGNWILSSWKLQGHRADAGDVEAVCILYSVGKRKNLQVMMTLLQKHWEWQEDRRKTN